MEAAKERVLSRLKQLPKLMPAKKPRQPLDPKQHHAGSERHLHRLRPVFVSHTALRRDSHHGYTGETDTCASHDNMLGSVARAVG